MTRDPSRLTLTREEKASPLWKRIEEYLHGRLHDLRLRNDGPMHEADRGPHIGRIAEVKVFLGIANEQPAMNFPGVETGRPGSSGTVR